MGLIDRETVEYFIGEAKKSGIQFKNEKEAWN